MGYPRCCFRKIVDAINEMLAAEFSAPKKQDA